MFKVNSVSFYKGIVHSEIPISHIFGFQLWVNLENKNKMIEPRYQEVKNADIPIAEKEGVKVKVIAGEVFGVNYSFLPTYISFSLKD